jgi:hypothetical protein
MTALLEHDALTELDAQLAALDAEQRELKIPEIDLAQYGNVDRQREILRVQSRMGVIDIERQKLKERRRVLLRSLDSEVSAKAAKIEHELQREIKAVVDRATDGFGRTLPRWPNAGVARTRRHGATR